MMVKKVTEKNKEKMYRLCTLGGMMIDGLHLQINGEWIVEEYKRLAKSLGLKSFLDEK